MWEINKRKNIEGRVCYVDSHKEYDLEKKQEVQKHRVKRWEGDREQESGLNQENRMSIGESQQVRRTEEAVWDFGERKVDGQKFTSRRTLFCKESTGIQLRWFCSFWLIVFITVKETEYKLH